MGAKEQFTNDFKKGNLSEQNFILECKKLGLECVKSTEKEDMEDHVDCIIKKNNIFYKIDVKGLKKINRFDSVEQEDYHYVELLNVIGNPGWLYGKADMFAFETLNFWIIVLKTDLQKLVKEKVKDEIVDRAAQCIYKKYTREKHGKKDMMTLVKTLDLVGISSKIIKKTI